MDNGFSNNVNHETAKCILTLKPSENITNRLVFSFDKENFDNFECNISDGMLNHEFLKKPEFGFRAPLGNSLDFFRTLYQHSLKKHDEEYREIIKKLYNMNCDKDFGSLNRKTFEDYCFKKDKELKKFLSKNDKYSSLFSVNEKDERIIYTENVFVTISSFTIDFCNLKSPEKNIRNAMIDFLIKFNEMYLQGYLGTKYLKSLTDLNDNYAKRSSDIASAMDEQTYAELFELFSKVDHLLQQNSEDLVNMIVEDRRKFYEEHLKDLFNKTSNSFVMFFLCDPFPDYLNFLIKKIMAKAFFHYSDNSDIFFSSSAEHIDALLELKNHLKKMFKGLDLSEKSIEKLIMFFLEDHV